MNADYFIYFFKRGTLYLKQEKYKEALTDFSASVELNQNITILFTIVVLPSISLATYRRLARTGATPLSWE